MLGIEELHPVRDLSRENCLLAVDDKVFGPRAFPVDAGQIEDLSTVVGDSIHFDVRLINLDPHIVFERHSRRRIGETHASNQKQRDQPP